MCEYKDFKFNDKLTTKGFIILLIVGLNKLVRQERPLDD